MTRVIGRVHRISGNAIVLVHAIKPALRIGDRAWFALDEHGGYRRMGQIEVETTTSDGCVFAQTDVRATCPAAAENDFIIAEDPHQPWTPYP